MKSKRRKNVQIALFISFLLLIWVVMFKIMQSGDRKRNQEYDDIEKSDAINERIIELKIIKGYCYVTFKNSKFVISSSQNYQYDSEYIHKNIFVGDSIIKKSGSDTIRIKGVEGERVFVHRKVINRHLR